MRRVDGVQFRVLRDIDKWPISETEVVYRSSTKVREPLFRI